jgi:hypothetical protein
MGERDHAVDPLRPRHLLLAGVVAEEKAAPIVGEYCKQVDVAYFEPTAWAPMLKLFGTCMPWARRSGGVRRVGVHAL